MRKWRIWTPGNLTLLHYYASRHQTNKSHTKCLIRLYNRYHPPPVALLISATRQKILYLQIPAEAVMKINKQISVSFCVIMIWCINKISMTSYVRVSHQSPSVWPEERTDPAPAHTITAGPQWEISSQLELWTQVTHSVFCSHFVDRDGRGHQHTADCDIQSFGNQIRL